MFNFTMMKLTFITILLVGVTFIWSFSSTENLNDRASLGKLLFNEKILSKDSSLSCSSCHNPNLGFADTLPFSVGIEGKLTKRNTPSVLNMKNRPYYFWDGRASSLEEQSLMPIQNPDEMGLPIKQAIYRLNQSSFYKKQFQLVFQSNPNEINLAEAIAAFENTLETSNSKFDEWGDNKIKLTVSEERGRQIFLSKKAKCFDCHLQVDFTNDDFKNIGLFDGNNLNDSGRFLITRNKDDLGKFKTPGLRNIAITGPYMHNGMFKTLEEVIDYYNDVKKVVPDAKNLDSSLLKPLGLSKQEKKDLVAFLKTLTEKRYAKK
jgi:cytochrome c peroxidase